MEQRAKELEAKKKQRGKKSKSSLKRKGAKENRKIVTERVNKSGLKWLKPD